MVGIHVHGEHALTFRWYPQIFKGAVLQIIGEQMTTRVRLITFWWHTNLLHPISNGVNAHMRGEIQFPITFDEIDVALALGNGFRRLFTTSFGEITEVINL